MSRKYNIHTFFGKVYKEFKHKNTALNQPKKPNQCDLKEKCLVTFHTIHNKNICCVFVIRYNNIYFVVHKIFILKHFTHS